MPEESNTRLKCLKFYENWWMLAEGRDTDDKRLAFYDAIMRYAFLGEVPSRPQKGKSHGKDWAAWDAFLAIKPVVDGALERESKVFAGRLGGFAGKGSLKMRTKPEIADQIADEIAEEIAPEIAELPFLIKEKDKDNKKEKDKDKVNNISSKDAEELFTAWWKSYPARRTDKPKCKAKFLKILKDSKDPVSTFNEIMNGLDGWKRSPNWSDPQYIMGTYRWLSNENWKTIPTGRGRVSTISNIHHDPNAEKEDAF